MISFLADENMERSSIGLLRKNDCDVFSVYEFNRGATDLQVMSLAMESGRTILTHDRDYGELVFKLGLKPAGGIVYFRLENYLPETPALILLEILGNGELNLQQRFTVVEVDRIRQVAF